jgi:hypothetical protein
VLVITKDTDDEPGSNEKVLYEFTECEVIKRTEDKQRILVIQKGVVEIHRRDYRDFKEDVFILNERNLRLSLFFAQQYNRVQRLNINIGLIFPKYVERWKKVMAFEVYEEAIKQDVIEMTDDIVFKARFFRLSFINFKVDNDYLFYRWKPYRSFI